ncbi:hypothetical protein PIROE2DRAFT_21042 [Piromyces sp. E2]|nr:hypothetical protein PIROE2DRAFT_21042 [Piromyces sp. E2]|eukprot:OUM60829.1 hypothetical protein PIROE2DRAFT_21042 [Piromyces sp. E2]
MENRNRIRERVKLAVQNKLAGIGLKSEKAESLAPIITDLIAEGKSKEDVNQALNTLIGEEYYKPSFTDWLFGYATFFINQNNTPAVTDAIADDIDISSDEEEEEKKEEKREVETKAQSQKNTLVKRRLSRSASSLDLASEVQKEVYGQAMAIAATTESLNKKQTEKTLEKKKSFSRRSSYAGSESGDKPHVVRCQYWPNCNRGDTCKFWHPKELCRKYPNCPDGDNCLYIHPAPLSRPPTKPQSPAYSSHASDAGSVTSNSSTIECKFGANCTRPDCKFSHPSPAAIVAMMNAKQTHSVQSKSSSEDLSTINIPCRYEPNCTRADCRFLHTKPRKF